MAQFNLVKTTARGEVWAVFSFINHTKLDYIAVADNCQSNFVESITIRLQKPTEERMTQGWWTNCPLSLFAPILCPKSG